MYNFSKALETKRFSEESIKEIKEYISFYNIVENTIDINKKFVEYGFNVYNSYCSFMKRFGGKFKSTKNKDNIDDWENEDWDALNKTIEQLPGNIEKVELKNNNVLLIYN